MPHLHEKIDFTVAIFGANGDARINETHEHIGMIYWARPRNGRMTLAPEEHHDIRWCAEAELDTLQPAMSNAVKWYCRQALAEIPRLADGSVAGIAR